ncbi:MAG: hypothetical protein RLZZ165_2145 [Bacteroidota bacterium]
MDNNSNRAEVYSTKIRAGKRTYFFDVKETRANDYYITITESKKKLNGEGYDKHKIFLYKEDFNKFMSSLNSTIDHVKTNLMPDYNYDEFDRENFYDEDDEEDVPRIAAESSQPYGRQDDSGEDLSRKRWEE